ncbi:MAG: site-2 protease family protein [Candidatus Sungbacteria bacterium]|nr:site-2 protease family protein [Candidatus Sungbacteria bacterium]
MDSATQFIFQIIILIFSVVIHEVSHGYAALALGDKTAQYAGRLTLNPIKHLDPFGSILLPIISYMLGGVIFGWARPVPYNPYNLSNQKWGPALVGAAGPAANISLAVVFGLVVRFLPNLADGASGLFIFNFMTIASTIALLNLVLAIFNLVPIPPLDGSKVLFAILPHQWRGVQFFLEQYGLFLLLIFIFFFARWIFPIVLFLFRFITGTLLFL